MLRRFRATLRRHYVTGARSSTIVSIGFAGLLLLMAVMVIDSTVQLRQVNARSARLRQEYRDRDSTLDDLRSNIFHANTMARDYLLSTEPDDGARVRAQLKEMQDRNDALLAHYGTLVLDDERAGFAALRDRAHSYLIALRATVDAHQKDTGPQAFYRADLRRHRSEIIGLLEEVNAIDHRDMDAGEERIQQIQSRYQRRVGFLSLLALIGSAALAMVVVLRHRHIEDTVTRHFNEIQAARQDLRSLSNRLVTAQEEERRNLSRELHDAVGQSMTAMLMDLGRLESRLRNVPDASAIFDSVRHAAEENVARIRDLSLMLRPSMLDELGLVPALQWQTRETMRRTGLKVKMVADEFDEDLPDAQRTSVYRIVQEALHNCVKHAHASEARVVIHRDEDAILVSVQDNGIGFDPKHQKGLGLLGMEERALRLGGRFRVESHPGGGSVLSVRFPLPEKACLEKGVA